MFELIGTTKSGKSVAYFAFSQEDAIALADAMCEHGIRTIICNQI